MKSVRMLTVAAMAVLLMCSACKEDKPATPDAPPAEVPAVEKEAEKPAEIDKPVEEAPTKGGREEVAKEGGKWVISNPYQVKFRVPEDWNVTIEDDGLSATDADETTTVVLIGSSSQGTIQTAVADVQKKVKIKDAKLQDTKDIMLNGFPAQTITGTAVFTKGEGAEAMDQEIQFIAYNVQVPKGVVTMMIFSDATMYEAKKETIDGLANTLVKSKS